jgi:hypothetical protein
MCRTTGIGTFVRPTAAIIAEIEGKVRENEDGPPRPPPPPKRKTAWERVLEEHPVFDRPWYLPSIPRIPPAKDMFPTFARWWSRVREWRSR